MKTTKVQTLSFLVALSVFAGTAFAPAISANADVISAETETVPVEQTAPLSEQTFEVQSVELVADEMDVASEIVSTHQSGTDSEQIAVEPASGDVTDTDIQTDTTVEGSEVSNTTPSVQDDSSDVTSDIQDEEPPEVVPEIPAAESTSDQSVIEEAAEETIEEVSKDEIETISDDLIDSKKTARLASVSSANASYTILNNGLEGINIDISSSPYTDSQYSGLRYQSNGCTWFAHARVRQLGYKITTDYKAGSYYYYRASELGYSVAGPDADISTINPPAILCWNQHDGKWDGHVAILEKKLPDGSIIISQGGDGSAGAAHGYASIQKKTVAAMKGMCPNSAGFMGYVLLNGGTTPVSNNQLPVGVMDSITGGNGVINLYGWAFDPDEPSKSIDTLTCIGGTIDSGVTRYYASANKPARRVNEVYGLTGNHGLYDETGDYTQHVVSERGTLPVYVYAVDSKGGDYGIKLLDGCPITVTINNPVVITESAPKGNAEEFAGEIGKVRIKGWAFDEDSIGTKVDLHVYVGGTYDSGAPCYQVKANGTNRPDVNNAYPGVGNSCGFDISFPVKERGTKTVYVYAINIGKEISGNPLIGTGTVTIGYPVSGISLNKSSTSLIAGKTETLNATVSPSNASNKNVTWTSSNTSVATISSTGVVTAKAAGTATITVKTADGGKTATCKVTVPAAAKAVTSVTMNKASLSLKKGESGKLTVTVSPSDATNKSVTWKSSNPSVATVSSDGTVKAIAKGTATITVTSSDGKKTATCTVTVTDSSTPTVKNGWYRENGKDYWYENNVKQGTYSDKKGVVGDGTIRGREIYDPKSNAWYWLDSVYGGAKAVGKEVWMPYVYQDEDKWYPEVKKMIAEESDPGMADCVYNAMINKTGKWVRYDQDGKMLKGWVTITGELARIYPMQAGNTYYYDNRTGLMAKGWVYIGGTRYHFDEITGVLSK